MRVITHARILEATQKRIKTETALDGWHRIIKANHPKDFTEMKRLFRQWIRLENFMYSISARTRIHILCCTIYDQAEQLICSDEQQEL